MIKCFLITLQCIFYSTLDDNISQYMHKQIDDAKLMLCSNLSQYQHRRMATDATGRSIRYTASYQADSTYACMHATKQYGDGMSAEYESGRTCEESAHSLGRALHEKPLCAHARGSRVQLRLYCTCRCNLIVPQALICQAVRVGSVIRHLEVAVRVDFGRLTDCRQLGSCYGSNLANKTQLERVRW